MASGSPDVAMTGFVDAFRRLPTNDSRRRALEALASELTPYEWRTMHALTSARSFHRDIVGELPLELVALVFAYLDTSTPYRLQRVSRRWNHVLQSLDVLKASLHVWGFVDLSDADHALCERKARRVHSLRHGIPRSSFRLNLDHSAHTSTLVGDTLIWHPFETFGARATHVLNLDTWKLVSMRGEGRELISRFRASEQLIAMTTHSNVCYISMLHGQGRRSFKMPSSQFLLHACRERTVALAACLSDQITVFIWNYDTQRGTSFSIGRHPSHGFFAPDIPPHTRHNLALLLQPETETVVVFGAVVCPEGCRSCSNNKTKRILCGRFTYDGQCIKSSHLPPLDDVNAVSIRDQWQITPVDQNGLVHAVGLGCHLQRYVLVQYDERLDGFTEIHGPAGNDSLWVHADIAWWNDTFYELELDYDGDDEPFLILSGRERATSKEFAKTPGEEPQLGRDMRHVMLNDSYVIYPVAGALYIHCFEHSDSRPRTDGPFNGVGTWKVL